MSVLTRTPSSPAARWRNLGLTGVDVRGGHEYTGGLPGSNRGTISASYAAGTVTGNRYVGGLAGYNDDDYGRSEGTISASYAIVTVTGKRYVGALVGSHRGTISASYAVGGGHRQPRFRRTGGAGLGEHKRQLL